MQTLRFHLVEITNAAVGRVPGRFGLIVVAHDDARELRWALASAGWHTILVTSWHVLINLLVSIMVTRNA